MLENTAPGTRTAKREIDQLIDARWIIPIQPAGVVLENHSLAIDGEDIVDLLPTDMAAARYRAKRHFRLTTHALLPGLINLHTHAAMTLMRGYADDKPLMRWLKEHIWPAESRHVSSEFVHDGTLLACWEMLRGGVTCFNDMYFFPADAARAALSAGIRAVLGITVFEFPSAYGSDADDYLHKGLATRESLLDEMLISFCLAPHAPYTVADRTFERVATIAGQLDLPIHIHVHETKDEIAGSLKEHGVRPLERLRRLELLSPGLIAVHAIHLEHDEIDLLSACGCRIAHCPTSNMKLANGFAPIGALLDRKISIGLGSDGAASNNRLDMLCEIRHAALLAKAVTLDAAKLPAHDVLAMATIQGARALGLEDRIGSLQTGKAADLFAVSMDDWMLQPCFDPASHLVYTLGRESVSHVWVAGKLRIDDKSPVDLDVSALLRKLELWQNTLSNQA
jgi:5-methylthioadenosine/S-adenosylhomocysteine deaminase